MYGTKVKTLRKSIPDFVRPKRKKRKEVLFPHGHKTKPIHVSEIRLGVLLPSLTEVRGLPILR